MKAFETEGSRRSRTCARTTIDEILPWDVLDVSITKRFLQIELIKAKKEWRTEDCKWGHCYACGVPGNGEDTVLAERDGRGDRAHPRRARARRRRSRSDDPAAYRDVAKGAAYRQKAMPDLPSASRELAAQGRPRLSATA